MLRTWVSLCALLSLWACKPPPQVSDSEHETVIAKSADQEAAVETTGSAMCDCARLIPIKFRPDFPRVSRPDVPGCRFSSADSDNRTLIVGLSATTDSELFTVTSAEVQSRYVKIHDSSQTLLQGGRALVGVASEPAGLTRYSVVDLAAAGYVATVIEALSAPASAAPAPGFPIYLQGLAIGVAGACPAS